MSLLCPGSGVFHALLSRAFLAPRPQTHAGAWVSSGERGRAAREAFCFFAHAPVNSNDKEDTYMVSPPIVSSFLDFLVSLGIRQRDVARMLGCSEAQVSRLRSGDRSLPLEDFRGLLRRLCREHPTQRAQLAEAAVAPILEGTGLHLRLVEGPPPAPAAPARGVVIHIDVWQARRAA